MRICIIATGGTIGCVGTPLAPLPAADFAAAIARLLGPALDAALPGIETGFDSALRFGSPTGMLDSADLRPADWCAIAGRVLALYDRYDGFVILHGTDSMDFTAAALSFLLNVPDPLGLPRAALSKPVVLTGAQLPLLVRGPQGLALNAGSDALANLAGALAATRAALPEVAIFFDGRLLRGNRALKVSTTRFAAFDSPHLPPLAEAGIGFRHGPARALAGPPCPALALDEPKARARAQAQLDAVADGIARHPVVQIPVVPAGPTRSGPLLAGLIDAACQAGARGIVLEAYGEGNVPAEGGATAEALDRASAGGVEIALVSRAIGGAVGTFHYAAGAWIAGTAALPAGDMTPVCALAKLAVLMSAAAHHGWDRATLRALFRRSLAGECAAGDRLAPGEVLHPGMALQSCEGAAVLENDPERGPLLRDAGGRVLWAPAERPARLLLLDRPVILGHDGAVLWQAPEARPGGVLIVTGGGETPPALALHDPAGIAPPLRLDAAPEGAIPPP